MAGGQDFLELDNKHSIPAEILAEVEAELAASRARIVELLKHSALSTNVLNDDTAVTEPLLLQRCTGLSTQQLKLRQREIRSLITSFEQRLDASHDLAVIPQRLGENAPLRLRSVAFFSSGAISFMGLDTMGRAANIYDTLDDFSIILKKVRRLDGSPPRKQVEFYTVTVDHKTDQ